MFMATTNMKLASSTLIPFPLTSIQLHIHCTELTTAVVIVFMATTNMKLDSLAPSLQAPQWFPGSHPRPPLHYSWVYTDCMDLTTSLVIILLVSDY